MMSECIRDYLISEVYVIILIEIGKDKYKK